MEQELTKNQKKNLKKKEKKKGVKVIPIKTEKQEFQVWTKKVGESDSAKILLLHGGPGMSHGYFYPFEKILPEKDIQIYYYDQLGSHKSSKPEGAEYDPLWTIERFVDEVEQVRVSLNLTKENFFLFGHSWGGILAIEYALKYQQNLKGLIISNMMSSCPQYQYFAQNILGPNLPNGVFEKIKEMEEKKDYQNPEYMELLIDYFYPKHVCRLEELPQQVKDSGKTLNFYIYNKLQGPSEFGVKGDLEKWDRSSNLQQILVPTLLLAGKYDTMDPKHLEWMSKQFKQGYYHLCENGSHMSFWDDQESYFKGLEQFINNVCQNHKQMHIN